MKRITTYILENRYLSIIEAAGITQISGDRIDSSNLLPLGDATVLAEYTLEKLDRILRSSHNGSIVLADIQNVVATDANNSYDKLLKQLNKFDKKKFLENPPKVFKVNELYYIADGHHRVLAWLILTKEQHIPVEIVII